MSSIAERLRHESRISRGARPLVSLGAGPRRRIERRATQERSQRVRAQRAADRARCLELAKRLRDPSEEVEFRAILGRNLHFSTAYFEGLAPTG